MIDSAVFITVFRFIRSRFHFRSSTLTSSLRPILAEAEGDPVRLEQMSRQGLDSLHAQGAHLLEPEAPEERPQLRDLGLIGRIFAIWLRAVRFLRSRSGSI